MPNLLRMTLIIFLFTWTMMSCQKLDLEKDVPGCIEKNHTGSILKLEESYEEDSHPLNPTVLGWHSFALREMPFVVMTNHHYRNSELQISNSGFLYKAMD